MSYNIQNFKYKKANFAAISHNYPAAYLLCQSQHVGGVEGRLEGRHLVEDATSRPNVHLLCVWLILNKFRTSRRGGRERERERERQQ